MLPELDKELAEQYGSYASYATETDPILIDTYGDSPADEVDRLLDIFVKPESYVLDVGCGAGQTLCRLAPKVKDIWGFDQDTKLLAANPSCPRWAQTNTRWFTITGGWGCYLSVSKSTSMNNIFAMLTI